LLEGLFYGVRNFVGLAIADPDFAFAVADDDQRRKTESTTALDDRRTTANLDDLLDQLAAIRLIAAAATAMSLTLAAPAARISRSAAGTARTARAAATICSLLGNGNALASK
jgi:hypothetical protein